jgi:uncharacterized membrane protein YedE/YeeE
MPPLAAILGSQTLAPARRGLDPARVLPLAGVVVLLSVATWFAYDNAGVRPALLLLVGSGLGFALQKSGFGFAGAWRAQVIDGRGAGLRSQLALLAILSLVFFPLFARGAAFGQPVLDIVRPVGVALLAGAFLFGIGAQLASACSSGSLSAVGRGKFRYVIVVVAMMAGATLGSAHFGWWEARASWFAVSLPREWGTVPGMAGNLAIIGLLAGASLWLEKVRHGSVSRPALQESFGPHRSWSLSRGVVVIAMLCAATLVLSGRPWTIMTAPPLWGAHLIQAFGLDLDVAFWDYWSADSRINALEASLWTHTATLMIGGLILGTALAAARSGSLAVDWKVRPGEGFSALLGGLLLGYGGVVGLGCNIGAFLGGASSGSLHGWFWLLAAFAGTAVGAGLKAAGKRLTYRG